ncbi:permease [Halolactibacillus miurensis]|nr:YitT family protein [Halolactibacillus miurensis]GEM03069.1 permease [Halolactibacillus miurensis]
MNESPYTLKSYLIRLFVFTGGLYLLAFGVSVIIKANLGTATWDVLHIGLSENFGLSIGRWVQIVGVLMVILTSFLEKKRIQVGSVLNIVFVGFFLNQILAADFIPAPTTLSLRVMMLLLGVGIMGIGSGMYVSSKIGAGPRDGMTLYISKRFSLSIGTSRTILETLALTSGWLLGGPVAIGTFVTVPLIGPIMQRSLGVWTKILVKVA